MYNMYVTTLYGATTERHLDALSPHDGIVYFDDIYLDLGHCGLPTQAFRSHLVIDTWNMIEQFAKGGGTTWDGDVDNGGQVCSPAARPSKMIGAWRTPLETLTFISNVYL